MEAISKQYGPLYASDIGPIAWSDSTVDAQPARFLAVPCLAMDEVPEAHRLSCLSIVDPHRPELFARGLVSSDGIITVEYDLEYDPRNPETFEKDASFYERYDLFFPGYNAVESVHHEAYYMAVSSQGRLIEVTDFQDTEGFRNAASFAFPSHSKWSTLLTLFRIFHNILLTYLLAS